MPTGSELTVDRKLRKEEEDMSRAVANDDVTTKCTSETKITCYFIAVAA
jgi:hypothetical protein